MTREQILKVLQEKMYLYQQTEVALHQLKGQIALLKEMLSTIEKEQQKENKGDE